MRLVGPLRLAGALVVTAAVLVTALAAGQQLTQRRSQSQQETDVQSFAPPPVGAAGAALAVPVRCDGPVLNTSGDRFAELAWSPDSAVLAATRPSAGGVGSRISLLYGSDWTANDIADGRGPRWSASGEMLAFEAEKPGTLRVVNVRTGKQLAAIAGTSNAYAWRGDILLFWRGAELRAWQGGSDSLRFEIAPEYSSARGYEPSFSGDASRFVVVRRDGGKIAGLLLGDTDDGRVSPQDVPVSYSWAPVGRRLLLQYSDRASLFSEAKQFATMGNSELPGAFTAWSSDGLRALYRSSSSALLRWHGKRIDPVANVATTGAETLLFTADSRRLAALETSGALKIRDCADAVGNDPLVKITRDQAIALVRQRPDVISLGWKIEAKLVVWAEIKRSEERRVGK